jgi:hypothetical protein
VTKQSPRNRGGWVLEGEMFTMARRWGQRGNSTAGIGHAWSWVKAHNQQLCATCGHDRLDHLGFHEPGCSHLGSCTCSVFQLASEKAS